MGLSNILPGGGGQTAAPAGGDAAAPAAAAPAHQDFGDKLGAYFKSQYPVAGGLANAVFGNNQPNPAAAVGQPATAPLAPMPNGAQQDTSLLAMNAQPQQGGGGLAALLKLFA